jgi:hypothetical protein
MFHNVIKFHNTIKLHNTIKFQNTIKFPNTIKLHNTKNIDLDSSNETEKMYNTNRFGTKTTYDYYIAMKFMFLVEKLFYHPSIVYASLTFLLPWSKPKPFKTKSLSKPKLQFSQTLHSFNNFVQVKVSLKVTNTPLNINQKKTSQETT